jgi:hypothetical protein
MLVRVGNYSQSYGNNERKLCLKNRKSIMWLFERILTYLEALCAKYIVFEIRLSEHGKES